MAVFRITPSAALPVGLDLATAYVGVDGGDMAALITSWIKGVEAALEHEIGQFHAFARPFPKFRIVSVFGNLHAARVPAEQSPRLAG